MKRGNEEKVMDPMFPRLHVNDADKGGPRAPPRNKMALYEQLSIPSQRFNPAVLPMNPNSNSSVVPSAFSSQGSRSERNFPFPVHAQPSTPTRQAEMFQARQSEGANVNMPLAQPEQRTKVGDEDDFRVPVFVQSRMGLCHSKPQTGIDKEKVTRISPPHSGHSVKLKNVKDLKQVSSPTLSLRRELGSEREDVSVIVSDLARDHAAKSATKISTRQKVDGPVEEVCASPNQDYAEYPATRFNRLSGSDACLLQDPRSGSQPNITGHGDGLVESTREVVEKGTASQKRSVSCSGEDASSPNEPDNNSECHGDRMGISPEMGHAEKSDDVSETSMVDSISGFDISPDDVVGIIGQKHFWKARKAIVNQQRLFAVQVFELHRLIKVQRLIAESPNLLLEDAAFLGASSLRCSPAKKLSSEYVVKPLLHVVKRKHEPEKTNNKMECSAENAVGKTSISFVKNGSQTSNYAPYLGNSPPARVTTDNNKANPWCFHQSPGHQLLIPVMSPSEGLVYKPYSGPGFMGPACGGCGPYSSTPMTGNFVKPLTYGAPSSHHQGMGVLPLPPPLGHTYFPPYGMSVVNPAMPSSAVEQLHWVAGPGSHGQIDQLSGGADSNMQHQSSCNIPSQKNGAVSHAKASNDSELQGSTANSPGDRAQAGTNQNTEESDALQLFPMAPVTQEEVPQSHDIGQRTRAIKVVPHNARTATASAARIFQSIQAERKQYD